MERIYGDRELTAAEMVHLASVLADAGYLVGVGKNYLQFYREVAVMRVPDNPIVRNMERTGYPDGKEPTYPCCPVCGQECETVYKTKTLEVIGCDRCLRPVDAWESSECFPGKE